MKHLLRRIISRIPRRHRYKILVEISKSLSITEIGIVGQNGRFSASIEDWTVARDYTISGFWDRHVVKFLIDLFEKNNGGTLIDVGANIGLISIPCACIDNVKCFAFEPDPGNFSLLRRNLIHNDAENSVKVFNSAVFSKAGTLELELSQFNHGDHRIRANHANISKMREHSRHHVSVPAARLDDVLDPANLHHPLVLKVDTQGAEPHVIQGASKLLSFVDVIFFEYWPYALSRLEGDVAAMRRMLTANFRTATVFDGDQPIPPFELLADAYARLDKLDPQDPNSSAEVIALR